MDAPAGRQPLARRFRASAVPMVACVFVLVSSKTVDKGGGIPERRPPVPPLYHKAEAATPLTTYQLRSCPSALLIATGDRPFYALTSVEDGVRFDIDADGKAEQMAWTERGAAVAFLAIERNGDKAITSGKELFGRHTWPGSPNGFSALSDMNMDANGGRLRGSVNGDDPLLARLLLWTDVNHNAISEPRELRPAGELFAEIGLGYHSEKGRDQFGNAFLFEGWAMLRTAPGRNRAASPEEEQERRRRPYSVCLARQGFD